MQREEVDYLLDTVSRLVSSHCDFRVRLEATEKAVRAQSGCSPVTSSNTVSIVQDTDDPALSGNNESEGSDDDAGSEDSDDVSKAVVTPLAKVRLEEIKQGARAKKSTWASVRRQYPPGSSGFSPLNYTACKRVAMVGTQATDMDSRLAVDEAYSQAATMAAYGIELLRVALSSTRVDRKLTRQASGVLATLCATLIDTRDQHRGVIASMAKERVDAFRRAKGLGDESELIPAGTASLERSSCHGRRDIGSVPNERNRRYPRDSSHSEAPKQRQQSHDRVLRHRNSDTTQRNNITLDSCAPSQIPSGIGTRLSQVSAKNPPTAAPPLDMAHESDNTAIESEVISLGTSAEAVAVGTQPSRQRQLMALNRQDVIRDALLRQGLSEPAIAAYFSRLAPNTNREYDGLWERWANWCIERGLDPPNRDSVELSAYLLRVSLSDVHKLKIRRLVERVWSIVEGSLTLTHDSLKRRRIE